MRIFVLLLFLGGLGNIHAQKQIKKTIVKDQIASVTVDLAGCYSLELNSLASDEIIVQASIEGADNDEMLVSIEENGGHFTISTSFQPNYLERSTKFGALTYIATDLKVFLPEYLMVNLFGTDTHVMVNGRFKQMGVTLADGSCILKGVFEKAKIKTQKGDITIKSAKGEVVANSTYGKVFLEEIPKGESVFDLNSVQGNIYVSRTD